MSAENPYKQLGLDEDATFEEIQAARGRLIQECGGDPMRQQTIEAAYDAILMERLRMRQEGKIKVPEGIRFAEQRSSQVTPATPSAPIKQSPAWLQNLVDTPSRADILWPAGTYLCLAGVSFYYPPVALALGMVAGLYFISRKEKKLGRALALSLLGVTAGTILSAAVAPLLQAQIGSIASGSPNPNYIAWIIEARISAWITLVILWLVTSFLR